MDSSTELMSKPLTFGNHPITERTVLWGLILGFSIVVILLGLAGFIAVRDSHSIRKNAARMVQEQLLVARLLHEVQAEEDALALGLHRLTRAPNRDSRKACLDDLDKANQAVALLAKNATHTPHTSQWQELAQATQSFTQATRLALDPEGPLPLATMENLFASHDVVVKLIHDLILFSTAHLAEVDQQIGKQLQDLADESAVLLFSCLLFSGFCAAGTVAFVRHSFQRIEWQSNELDRVSWHMLQTQEETARRFSHELHDELGQSLAAVRSSLTKHTWTDPESQRNDSVALVDQAIANVRELSQLLRPVILDDFGLDAGLRWLAEKFAQRTQVHMEYESQLETRLHSSLETHLFRIAQEALTNIARHSKATEVRILLSVSDQQVRLVVEDNGCGLTTTTQPRSSLGLTGMRARARECGGRLELSPVRPHGLRVEVTTPLKLEPEVETDDDPPLSRP
jgi:signal transduction histidine kinase